MRTTDDVLEYLRTTESSNYILLKELIDRDIPIEYFQANLMYMKRGYGKTWMSYCMVASDLYQKLQTKESYPVSFESTRLDKDCTTHARKQEWLRQFSEFIAKYFSDIELIRNESNATKLTYRLKDKQCQ